MTKLTRTIILNGFVKMFRQRFLNLFFVIGCLIAFLLFTFLLLSQSKMLRSYAPQITRPGNGSAAETRDLLLRTHFRQTSSKKSIFSLCKIVNTFSIIPLFLSLSLCILHNYFLIFFISRNFRNKFPFFPLVVARYFRKFSVYISRISRNISKGFRYVLQAYALCQKEAKSITPFDKIFI